MNPETHTQNKSWLIFVWIGALLLLLLSSRGGTLVFGMVAILVAPILLVGTYVGAILLWRRYHMPK